MTFPTNPLIQPAQMHNAIQNNNQQDQIKRLSTTNSNKRHLLIAHDSNDIVLKASMLYSSLSIAVLISKTIIAIMTIELLLQIWAHGPSHYFCGAHHIIHDDNDHDHHNSPQDSESKPDLSNSAKNISRSDPSNHAIRPSNVSSTSDSSDVMSINSPNSIPGTTGNIPELIDIGPFFSRIGEQG